MKRSTFTALGLEKEVVDTIMQEHHTAVETIKERYNEQTDDLKTKLKTAQDALKELQAKDDGKDYKALYEAEQKAKEELAAALKTAEDGLAAEKEAHEKTVAGYTAEKEAADIDGKIAAALKAAGMNEAAIPKALKDYDRSLVKRGKDGAVENADKVLEHIKAEWGAFFGEVKEQGAEVGVNPGAAAPQSDFKFNFTPIKPKPQEK